MKLLNFNDPHFAAKPPASRKQGYTEQILAKFREIVDFANEQNVDVLSCTGDWFISKRPEVTPYWLLAEINDILWRFRETKLTAIGNHDCESIEQFKRSPLNILCKAANMDYHEKSGIAYTNYKDGVEIAVVNYDKGQNSDGIWKISEEFRKDTKCRIIIAHSPIVRPEHKAIYPKEFLDKAVNNYQLIGSCDFLFYGDIHDYHGIYTKDLLEINKFTTFCNVGSIARNSAHELNRSREVQAVLFDSETKIITPVELESVKPIDEVFRVEALREEKENEAISEAFVDSLNPESLNFKILSPEILRDRLQSEPLLTEGEKNIGRAVLNEYS